MNVKENNCPCCPNNCSKEELRCGKGYKYFNIEMNDTNHQKNNFKKKVHELMKEDNITGLLMQCFHKIMQSSNDISKDQIFDVLTDTEKDTLRFLLKKVNQNQSNNI